MTDVTQTVPLVRMPRREVWLDVPEYPGFRVKLWANHPGRLIDDLQSGDEGRILDALSQIVVEHNGWADADGNPYPPASDPRIWRELPAELVGILAVLINDAATQLPNSLTRTRQRSGRR